MNEPTSNIFRDTKNLISDLNMFARFPVDGPIADLAAMRVAEILQKRPTPSGKDGAMRPPRAREILAACRVVDKMVRTNQAERDAASELVMARHHIQTAIQVNINQDGTGKDSLDVQLDKRIEAALAALEAETTAIPEGLPGDQAGPVHDALPGPA
jgi:hypothetical protein